MNQKLRLKPIFTPYERLCNPTSRQSRAAWPGPEDSTGKVKKRLKTKLKNQTVGVNSRKSELRRIDSELNLTNICSEKSSK